MTTIIENFTYLRPQKASQSLSTLKNLENRTGHLDVKTFENCMLIPDYSRTEENDNNHKSDGVCETFGCTAGSKARLYHTGVRNNLIRGNCLFGGFYLGVYGHFLVETLARIWYFFESKDTAIDKIVFVSDDPQMHPPKGNIRRFLELSGLLDKMVLINCETSFDHLIVPDMALSHFWYADEFRLVFDIVRTKVLQNRPIIPSQKVFLTRSGLSKAKENEININKLDAFFLSNGYKLLSPEKMTLDELIVELSKSTVLSSINGTLAHNILFAPKSMMFNIIERHGFINSWQMGCDLVSKSPATYIDCYDLPQMSNPIGFVFLYSDTKYMHKWAQDNHMTLNTFLNSPQDHKRTLKNFLQRCKRQDGYTPYYLDFDIKRAPIYAEAIVECESVYSSWLRRKRPLFITDYFNMKVHKNWWVGPLYRKIVRKFRSFMK